MVNKFGEESLIMTPMDNMNIIKILNNFGMDDFEDIIDNKEMKDMLVR
jgi:hypothetical protein